ncbi:hypothetical protein [Pseudophaeobacter sp.]|uniref:globin domain-containing protein n=1 Tax=Pseudophaeobacter sp. TaxID=1971739 RepID=UPI003299DF1F
MKDNQTPAYPAAFGYYTKKVRDTYIDQAIAAKTLPQKVREDEDIMSLVAPIDPAQPIQFWQLYSVLGPERILALTTQFYQRVFVAEPWFRSVFERVGGVSHHANAQALMWADVMGGGRYYHGGEDRLNFHHHHNAMQLMTDAGARHWAQIMRQSLDESASLMSHDTRIRPAMNTFLAHFFAKYASEFTFTNDSDFGESNPLVLPVSN